VAFDRIVGDNGYSATSVVAIGDSMTECWAAEQLGIPFLGIAAEHGSTQFPAGVPTQPSLQGVAALLRIH